MRDLVITAEAPLPPLPTHTHTHTFRSVSTPMLLYCSICNISPTVVPLVHLLPELAIADVEEEFTFVCDVVGGPNNTFQWEKNSEIQLNETRRTLQLTNVAVSDAGLYQCTVTNAAGNTSDSTQLYVAPNIIIGPENITVANVSVSITFMTVAEGFPVPDITWEYDEGN